MSAVRGSAACSECHKLMLNGVMPVEPPFFCPDHPQAIPLMIESCDYCAGNGWNLAPGHKQLQWLTEMEKIWPPYASAYKKEEKKDD